MIEELLEEIRKQQPIFIVESGSKAYGTDTEESDSDYKGILFPSVETFLGLGEPNDFHRSGDNTRKNDKNDIDVSLYHLKKFLKLAMNANPNIIEMLFVDEKSILLADQTVREILLPHREKFLSNHIFKSFGGFCMSLRKKMEGNSNKNANLVEIYGYDTKSFMHSIRLYEMGIEAFITGTMHTRRGNNEWLKEIRKGAFTKEEALKLMDSYEEKFHVAREQSILLEKPDYEFINRNICMKMVRELLLLHD